MAKSVTPPSNDDRIRPSTDQLGSLTWDEQFSLKEGDVVHTRQGRPSALTRVARREFTPSPLGPNATAAMTAVDFGTLHSFGPNTL